MLAHLRKWKGDVHIDQRAELMVVDANMSDDEIERRIETRDHRNETVRLLLWRRRVLWIMTVLAKVARHSQAKFCSKSLGNRKEGRIAESRPHVVIQVIDPEAGAFRPLDLRPQLPLDLTQIRVVSIEVFRRRKEKTVLIHERWDGGAAEHRAPAIILPLGVEREVNAHGNRGMALEQVYRLLIPRSRKHHRHRYRKAGLDEFLEAEIYAVTHARIVGADDQVNLFGGSRMPQRVGLTSGVRRGD